MSFLSISVNGDFTLLQLLGVTFHSHLEAKLHNNNNEMMNNCFYVLVVHPEDVQ